MKVFLDVGANTGQTARVALDRRYAFDRIVSFEPAPQCWSEIEAIGDPRLELCKFGLSNRTCRMDLHDPGSQGASIYEDMDVAHLSSAPVKIDLVRASDWFREHVTTGDTLFVKLNCEGSECDIVDDLIDSGELRKVYNANIAFDVRRSPTLRSREVPLRKKLRRFGYQNVAFSEDVMRGVTHEDRIRHWLDLVGASENLPLDELKRKYAPTLAKLSSRSGRLLRIEQSLRTHLFKRLPAPLKDVFRLMWGRLMRGHRQGPA